MKKFEHEETKKRRRFEISCGAEMLRAFTTGFAKCPKAAKRKEETPEIEKAESLQFLLRFFVFNSPLGVLGGLGVLGEGLD